MALNSNLFETKEALNDAFVTRIAEHLQASLAESGRASLVVSGGRTPVALFNALSRCKLDWQNIDITLADDRWVAPSHEASNEKLVREHLLVNQAREANFVGLTTTHNRPEEAEAVVNQRLNLVKQPFDVLILGMGEDGHTASLFPCAPELTAGLDMASHCKCLAVNPTSAPHPRMSINLKTLLQSKHIYLHLTGDAKKQVLHQAEEGTDIRQMPIRAFLQNADVNLMWAP